MRTKLKLEGEELTIEEGDDSFTAKLLKGCRGEIQVKSPFLPGGSRKIKKVKDKNGKVLKDKK